MAKGDIIKKRGKTLTGKDKVTTYKDKGFLRGKEKIRTTVYPKKKR